MKQETFIYSDKGFDLEWIRWGEAEKIPTWLFIHGFGGNARTFAPVIKLLVDSGETVLSVSLPFHGGSSDIHNPSQFFDITILGDCIANLAKQAGLKNYSLVSHSLGSRILLWIAVNRPGEAQSYHIMNPAGFYTWEIRFFSSFTSGIGAYLLDFEWISKLVTSILIPNPEKRTIDAFKWLTKSYPYMCLHKQKVFIQLFKIMQPMHIYWGDKDRLLPLSFAYEVKQHFAKGMVHVIENCGHLPMREQPEKLARLLKSNRDTDLLLLNPL